MTSKRMNLNPTLQRFLAVAVFMLFLSNPALTQNYERRSLDASLGGAQDVEVFDIDQDGDLDVFAVGLTSGVVVWYENDGNNQFTKIIIATPGLANHLFISDLDDDGDFDLVVTRFEGFNLNKTSLLWLKNDGQQNFTSRVINTEHNFWRLYVTDVNGDGLKDILTTTTDGNNSSPVLWFENNGIEIFTKHIIESNPDNPYGIIAADLDGDANSDIVLTVSDDAEVLWYEYTAPGIFTKFVLDQNAPTVSNVIAADLDDDGDTDILTASFAGVLTLYENDGTSLFTKKTLFQRNGSDFWEILVADMDGDLDKDIVATSIQTVPFFSPSLFLLTNDGAGTFETKILESQFALRGAAIGAPGDEGFVDIFAVSNLGSSVLLFEHIVPPDFKLKVTPEIKTVVSGNSTTFAVSLDSVVGGFDRIVELSMAPNIAEITPTFEPLTISPGDASTLSFATTPMALPGDYQFIVTGVADTLARSDTLTLRILPPEENTIPLTAGVVQTAGDAFWIDIDVGSESMPIGALFGASFVLNYDGAFAEIPPPFSESIAPGELLGDSGRIIFFAAPLTDDSVSIAITRKDGDANASGFGALARVQFRSFPETPDSMRLHFTLTSITAHDSAKNRVILHPADLWVTVLKQRDIVWPGDTNNNGIVNQADVLPIGFYWHGAGPRRVFASLDWNAQTAILWSDRPATYADADGQGRVDEADVIPIGLNWGRTHDLSKVGRRPLQISSTQTGKIKTNISPGGASDEIWLNTEIEGVNDLFGVAFEMHYPETTLEIVRIEPGKSWGGAPLMYSKHVKSKGRLGLAVSLTDGNFDFSDHRGALKITFKTTDAFQQSDLSEITLADAVAMDKSGAEIELISDLATAVEQSSNIPTEFRLYQNFPNPFNPETTIQYQLPSASDVRIEIFDLRGGKIKTLTHARQEAGVYKTVWNGANDQGASVASGVYVYQIIAGDFRKVKKCILMK